MSTCALVPLLLRCWLACGICHLPRDKEPACTVLAFSRYFLSSLMRVEAWVAQMIERKKILGRTVVKRLRWGVWDPRENPCAPTQELGRHAQRSHVLLCSVLAHRTTLARISLLVPLYSGSRDGQDPWQSCSQWWQGRHDGWRIWASFSQQCAAGFKVQRPTYFGNHVKRTDGGADDSIGASRCRTTSQVSHTGLRLCRVPRTHRVLWRCAPAVGTEAGCATREWTTA